MIERIEKELQPYKMKLTQHGIYKEINSIENVKSFMEYHVFAVWDFMSLLKYLQISLTTTTVPWKPSGFPKASRLINEIVWGEESDVNRIGVPKSHYEMYLEAMEELGADTKTINSFVEGLTSMEQINDQLEAYELPQCIRNFINFTFDTIKTGKPHIVASVFTFGREDLIPDMFIEIIKKLSDDTTVSTKDLIYYFERHIEVDSGEHGPLALEMIHTLCGDDPKKWEEALNYSILAMKNRIALWDGIYDAIKA
ncbi:DUF3050 domain-containing protein [Flavobacteriaceae bacterium]|nr:DUF3050 domain-containing protein [Flavobacteriaceae bacterium]